jgi:hexosaminidase
MTRLRRIKIFLIFFSIALIGVVPYLAFSESSAKIHLMPLPSKISLGEGKLRIDSEFRVALTGFQEPRLRSAVLRLIQRLSAQTGIPLPVRVEPDPRKALLAIVCQGQGEKIQSIKENESYTLEVTASGIKLQASTPAGVLRGMETFLQLVALDSEGFYVPVVQIQDKPRFPWRGLLIDVCRHWMPAEVIKRNLDAMAAVKLNVLHWHLSEDQGFRVESKTFPRLHGMGSDGNYYAQEQVREIIEYARDRGIRVIPEFDMPGHSTAWFVGYPELASGPGPYQIERHWGIFDPCMDPTRNEVYAFLDKFIGEMAKLFADEYFHIGGDEVNGIQWNANPKIQAFKNKHGMKDNMDLQAYFNKKIQSILAKKGKKMIGWDEILHPDLPKNIVVQSWRGKESLADGSRQGYMGILSSGYYLDHMLPTSEHYQVDPLEKEKSELDNEQKERILGGEACMWAEFVNPEIIDSRIWPRLAAIAERFWSPQDVKDVEDMYRRLEVVCQKLDLLGVTHRSNYPKMLQRLVGNHPIDSVKLLADYVEPFALNNRESLREYTQMTPLNRLVDAARPESSKARQFRKMVDEMLADAPGYGRNRENIKEWLVLWRNNHSEIKPILEQSFLLNEILPLSESLRSIAELGLEAISYLENGQPAPQDWLGKSTAILKRPEKPEYEVIIMILPAVQRLVEAASGKK